MLTNRRAAFAAAVLVALPAIATAAQLNIDTWMGKVKGHRGDFVSVTHERGEPEAQVYLAIACRKDGQRQVFGLQDTAPIRGNEVDLVSRKAYDGSTGYLKVHASVRRGKALKGKVTWKVPSTAVKHCKGTARLRDGEYHLSHGG